MEQQFAISAVALTIIGQIKKAIEKSPTGVSFINIKNYTSKSTGEVSDHLINIGVSYENQKAKDIKFLENMLPLKMKWKSSLPLIVEAQVKIRESLLRPNETMSNAQQDAYTPLAKGIKYHNETGALYIYGYGVKKTVIVPGEYKHTNHRPLTIAQNEIKKYLRTEKFRNFALSVGNVLVINGCEIYL